MRRKAATRRRSSRSCINDFVKRGGGLVVIHTAAVSMKDPAWWKSVIGGSWVPDKTKWKEGPMDLYYVENQRLGGGHPITKGASNFHLDDEIYYDMDILPEVARARHELHAECAARARRPAEGGKAHIYDIQPQMWTYEQTAEGGTQPYRAFVSIPGPSLQDLRAAALSRDPAARHRLGGQARRTSMNSASRRNSPR